MFRAAVLAVRDYARKCGVKGVLLGLSGGMDSALVACIAVEALGAENVFGVLMPSRFSSGRVRTPQSSVPSDTDAQSTTPARAEPSSPAPTADTANAGPGLTANSSRRCACRGVICRCARSCAVMAAPTG
ncbi:MAG: hypothetical protein II621_03725, partial [Clostridia bacterium]|nr:hypothetical protein [Clostridia bacterium]